MANDLFLELDQKDWDKINSSGGTIGTGINKAIHKLVISIANLRSGISSQLGYLQNKIERLQNDINQLNQSFKQLNENIEKAGKSSTKLAGALNKLTFWAVIIAAAGVITVWVQFLYTNHIWPFTQ